MHHPFFGMVFLGSVLGSGRAWRQAGVCRELNWLVLAVLSPASESCLCSCPHCTAPHASGALSETPAQLHLPALKGLRRG